MFSIQGLKKKRGLKASWTDLPKHRASDGSWRSRGRAWIQARSTSVLIEERWNGWSVRRNLIGGGGTHMVRDYRSICGVMVALRSISGWKFQRSGEMMETALESAKKHTEDGLPCAWWRIWSTALWQVERMESERTGSFTNLLIIFDRLTSVRGMLLEPSSHKTCGRWSSQASRLGWSEKSWLPSNDKRLGPR